MQGTSENQSQAGDAGAARQRIARSIIALHKERFGRGPVAGKAYIHDDAVLVLLSNGHTVAEETLHAGGGAADVASQRVRTSATMEDELRQIVEEETGRKVISVLGSSKQEPSVIAFVFVLEAHEVLSAVPDASADA